MINIYYVSDLVAVPYSYTSIQQMVDNITLPAVLVLDDPDTQDHGVNAWVDSPAAVADIPATVTLVATSEGHIKLNRQGETLNVLGPMFGLNIQMFDCDATGTEVKLSQADEIVPHWFGAFPGSTPVSSEMQDALNCCVLSALPLHLSAGEYTIANGTTLAVDEAITIFGDGKTASKLIYDTTTSDTMLEIGLGAAEGITGVRIRDLGFECDTVVNGTVMLNIANACEVQVQGCFFKNCDSGLLLESVKNTLIRANEFEDFGDGIKVDGSSETINNLSIIDNVMRDQLATFNSTGAMTLVSSSSTSLTRVMINSNILKGVLSEGVHLEGMADTLTVSSNVIETESTESNAKGIVIHGPDDVSSVFCDKVIVQGNRIVTVGSSAQAIRLQGQAKNLMIASNSIELNGGSGIYCVHETETITEMTNVAVNGNLIIGTSNSGVGLKFIGFANMVEDDTFDTFVIRGCMFSLLSVDQNEPAVIIHDFNTAAGAGIIYVPNTNVVEGRVDSRIYDQLAGFTMLPRDNYTTSVAAVNGESHKSFGALSILRPADEDTSEINVRVGASILDDSLTDPVDETFTGMQIRRFGTELGDSVVSFPVWNEALGNNDPVLDLTAEQLAAGGQRRVVRVIDASWDNGGIKFGSMYMWVQNGHLVMKETNPPSSISDPAMLVVPLQAAHVDKVPSSPSIEDVGDTINDVIEALINSGGMKSS